MAGHQTFTMIKPTAFKKNYAGAILNMITGAGFRIKAMKLTRLTLNWLLHFMQCTVENLFSIRLWSL